MVVWFNGIVVDLLELVGLIVMECLLRMVLVWIVVRDWLLMMMLWFMLKVIFVLFLVRFMVDIVFILRFEI